MVFGFLKFLDNLYFITLRPKYNKDFLRVMELKGGQ